MSRTRRLPAPFVQSSHDFAALAHYRGRPPLQKAETRAVSRTKHLLFSAFEVISQVRPEIQAFVNPLLQYDIEEDGRRRRRQRLTPDLLVALGPALARADLAYVLPVQPTPCLIIDCLTSFGPEAPDLPDLQLYQREVKAPFYLLVFPEQKALSLYRRERGRYRVVAPDTSGRVKVPGLEAAFAIHEGRPRVWFRGDLMGTTAELQASIDGERHARLAAEERAESAEAEVARLRAEVERLRRR